MAIDSLFVDQVSIGSFWARFWSAMDQSDYDAIIDSLTGNCRWLRSGWCEGHEAIRASLDERPANLVSRHLVNNLVIEPDGNGYDCRYTLIIFGAQRETVDDRGPYVTSGARVADYRAILVGEGGSWKVAEIQPELVFERPQ